ncbi:MAG TPA: imidazole glycerol phosphate synthase subunit HisH [Kofleriaceae bacterium]
MIAIVDACSGNLRSVERALARAGGAPVITRDPDVVRRADKIVVPGQGAFGEFIRGLGERGLGEALREAIGDGRPYLGICLGLQVLFEASEESPGVAGLGVLRGAVTKLAADGAVKVPHVGWNRVHGADPLMRGIPDDSYFYFVHSYRAEPADGAALSTTHGVPFAAAVRRGNVFACQFHPEKSQGVGLALLANFVAS